MNANTVPDTSIAWKNLSGLDKTILLVGIAYVPISITTRLTSFSIAEPVALAILAAAVLCGLYSKTREGSPTYVTLYDLALCIYFIAEVFFYLRSQYKPNSIGPLSSACEFFLIYQMVRFSAGKLGFLAYIAPLISVLGLAVSADHIVGYIHWSYIAKAHGFYDLSVLKAYAPAVNGYLQNSLSGIMLLFLPFAIFSLFYFLNNQRYFFKFVLAPVCAVAVLAIICSLELTLSRSGYTAIIAFVAVFLTSTLLSRRQTRTLRLQFVGIICFSLLLIYLFSPSQKGNFWQMFAGSTPSQIRSTEGRIAIWKNTFSLVKAHPLVGVGPNNFPLAYAGLVGPNPGGAMVSQPYDIWWLLLAERGIFGCLIYGFLIACALYGDWRRVQRSRGEYFDVLAALRMASVFSILVYELTFSVVLLSPIAFLLFGILIATALPGSSRVRLRIPASHRIQQTLIFCGHSVLLLVVGTIVYSVLFHEMGKMKYLAARREFRNARYGFAVRDLTDAIHYDPRNAYYYAARGLAREHSLRLTSKPDRLGNLDDVLSGDTLSRDSSDHAMDNETTDRSGLDTDTSEPSSAGGAPSTDDSTKDESGAGRGDRAVILQSYLDYKMALSSTPYDDNFLYNLSRLAEEAGDRDNYESFARQAVLANASDPIYRATLGTILDQAGNQSEADAQYIHAALLSPQITRSNWFMALAVKDPDRGSRIVEQAIGSLKSQLKASEDPILGAKLGALYITQGQYQIAIPLLQHAVAELPQLSMAWENLGLALSSTNHNSEAIAAYQRAIFLAHDPVAENTLAILRSNEKKPRQALALWSQSLRQSRTTAHAFHVERFYLIPPIAENDIVPQQALYFYDPAISKNVVYAHMASSLNALGLKGRADYFLQQANSPD